MKEEPTSSTIPRRARHTYNAARLLEHVLGARRSSAPVITRQLAKARSMISRAILEDPKCTPTDSALDIPDLAQLPLEEVHERFVKKGRPFVMRGAARDWQCASSWTIRSINARYGDLPVHLVDDHVANDDSIGNVVSLSQVIDSFTTSRPLYARFVPIIHRDPAILNELNMGFCEAVATGSRGFSLWGSQGAGRKLRSHFFVGSAGQTTRLHCELTGNLFINVVGQKRWRIYSAEFNPCLYSPVNRGPGVFGSPIDPNAIDCEAYPLARYAKGYDVTLEPGDVLHVPPFYWHHVDTLTDSISLGLRWYDFQVANRVSSFQNLLSMIATNPPMLKALKKPLEYGETHSNKRKK